MGGDRVMKFLGVENLFVTKTVLILPMVKRQRHPYV